MVKFKNEARWSDELGKYVDGIIVNDVFYDSFSYTKYVEHVGTTHYVTNYVSSLTGEVLYSVKRSTLGRNKSKCWLDNNTSNVAKDKMLKRVNVKQDCSDILEYFDKYSDYMQVSAGLNHTVREDIIVDIDDFVELDPAREYDENVTAMQMAIRKKMGILFELGIPMPSMFQIHTRNGHAQLHYILDRSVKVYNIYVDGKSGILMERKTADWDRYRDVLRFFAFLLGGDQHYTGWQIKNPCVTDPVFVNEFITYWNDGRDFCSIVKPGYVRKYAFDDLYSYVDRYVGKGVADNYDRFLSVLFRRGVAESEPAFLEYAYNTLKCFASGNGFARKKCSGMVSSIGRDVTSMESSERAHRERSYLENLSRNGFVREYTIGLVRKSRNTIDREWCRKEVRGALRDIIGDIGYMNGTVNKGDYSDDEFDRDFNGAYDYATANYDESVSQWTDTDRERSLEYRRMRKYSRMVALVSFLLDNPERVDDNNANNKAGADAAGLKSARTVSSYKRELGISGSGNDGVPESAWLWFSDIGRYREYCEMLESMRERVKSDSDKVVEGWARRIADLGYDRVLTDRIEARINTAVRV